MRSPQTLQVFEILKNVNQSGLLILFGGVVLMQMYTIPCSIDHLVIKEPVKSLTSPKRYPDILFLFGYEKYNLYSISNFRQ